MWDGLALLSPLLAFPQRLRPPPFLLSLIRRLNARLGPWPVVPYSRLYLDMLTDPVRRQEVRGPVTCLCMHVRVRDRLTSQPST